MKGFGFRAVGKKYRLGAFLVLLAACAVALLASSSLFPDQSPLWKQFVFTGEAISQKEPGLYRIKRPKEIGSETPSRLTFTQDSQSYRWVISGAQVERVTKPAFSLTPRSIWFRCEETDLSKTQEKSFRLATHRIPTPLLPWFERGLALAILVSFFGLLPSRPRVGHSGGPVPDPSPGPRALRILFSLSMLVLIASEAFFRLFSQFASYDDMGYVMMSLQLYREGQPLYEQVFSQYGPFYYSSRDLFYGGVPISHDLTGFITILHSLLCCLFLSLTTYRLTGQFFFAALTAIATSSILVVFANEPGHPQETCCLLVSLFAFTLTLRGGKGQLASVLMGSLGGFLILTKINVGIFLFLPTFFWLSQPSLPEKWRGFYRTLFVIGAGLFPFLLMREQLSAPWGASLAILMAATLLPLSILTSPPAPNLPRKFPGLFLAGMFSALFLLLAQQVHRGTDPATLWDSLFVQPSKFSGIYFNPYPADTIHIFWALFALALFLLSFRRSNPKWVSLLRWAAGVHSLLLFGAIFHGHSTFALTYLAPFLWLSSYRWRLDSKTAPPSAEGIETAEGRSRSAISSSMSLLTTLSGFLLLQVYPVAGSQIATSLILIPVVAAVGLSQFSQDLLRIPLPLPTRKWVHCAAAAVLLVLLMTRWEHLSNQSRQYHFNTKTHLPGMSRFQLPPAQAATLQEIAHGLQHYDTFVTLPGLYSFYFWTEKKPPTGENVTAWMTLLDNASQEEIVDQLQGSRFVGAVKNQEIAENWCPGETQIPDGPLVDYINLQMKVVDRHGGYEILEIPGND